MKNFKRIIWFSLFSFSPWYFIYSQAPTNDHNWEVFFDDDFTNTLKEEWGRIYNPTPAPWDQQIFRNKSEIDFIPEGGGNYFMRQVAEVIPPDIYSDGIGVGWNLSEPPFDVDYFRYGYYEIEARLTQLSGRQSGLWPAFWFQHNMAGDPPTCWYEEMDIFEPGYWMVLDQRYEPAYGWVEPIRCDTLCRDTSISHNSMHLWHKYAMEWLPGKLIYYLDDIPVYWLIASEGDPVPTHVDGTGNVFIDLQGEIKEGPGGYPDLTTPHLLGYFDIDYFRYWRLIPGSEIIDETEGNGYNFNTFSYGIKQSCIFKNTSVPSSPKIAIRYTDFVELKANFTVPDGVEFGIFSATDN